MSLDDKIAAIMSGKFTVVDSPLARPAFGRPPLTSPSPLLATGVSEGLTDSARNSPLLRSNTLKSPPTISSPISSPFTRGNTINLIPGADPGRFVGGGVPVKSESPLPLAIAQSATSHRALESMLSEYRSTKSAEVDDCIPASPSERRVKTIDNAPPSTSSTIMAPIPMAAVVPPTTSASVRVSARVPSPVEPDVITPIKKSARIPSPVSLLETSYTSAPQFPEGDEEEEGYSALNNAPLQIEVASPPKGSHSSPAPARPEFVKSEEPIDLAVTQRVTLPVTPPVILSAMEGEWEEGDGYLDPLDVGEVPEQKGVAWEVPGFKSEAQLPQSFPDTPKKGGGRVAKPPTTPLAPQPAPRAPPSAAELVATAPQRPQTANPQPQPQIARQSVPAKTVSIQSPAPAPTASKSSGASKSAMGQTPAKPPAKTPDRNTTPSKGRPFYTPGTGSKAQSSVLQVPPLAAPRPIRLAVRVRPFSEFELSQNARRTISKGVSDDELVIVNPNAFDEDPDTVANAAKALDNKQWAQSFRFDRLLWDYDPILGENHFADQTEVHESLGLDIVDNVLNGVSCSCFAYGHTSTGKTFSLFGDPPGKLKGGNLSAAMKSVTINPDSGLVPRVFRDIITSVKVDRNIQHGSRLFISYLEIYNERVVDLLDDSAAATDKAGKSLDALKVREHPTYGPYVEGLRKVEVFSVEDVLELLAKCQKKRASAQTAWNSQSSRSHAVVTLELTNGDLASLYPNVADSSSKKEMLKRALASGSKGKDELDVPISKVQMVDLAGSEKDSLRDDDEPGGFSSVDATPGKQSEAAEREKNELKLIRRSLATLSFIIQSLAKGASFRSLPYRDSILTFLLRDALNGYNHTTMLATISPAHIHYEETLSTLRYAEKLTLVRRKIAANDDALQGALVAQNEMVEEFRAFHHDVGSKRGTLSAKQMLQYTVTDPRQRIAKLTHSQQLVATTPKGKPLPADITFTSPIDGKVKRLTELNGEDLEHLQSSYRSLQGQVIEMQIDFDAVKTDRDSLLVELRSAKDQQGEAEKARNSAEGKLQSALKALKAAEKDLGEHKMMLRRKDENIERLVAELTDQKQARANAEQAYHTRTKEFLARFDTLKKENKAMEAALELANNRDGIYGAQKLDLVTQLDKLKTQVEHLHGSLSTLQEENGGLKATNMDLEKKLTAAEDDRARLHKIESEHQDVCSAQEALRREADAVRSERDSLAAIVKQKDSLLWLQGQQSEMSIKMLQQRQAALERTDVPTISIEDWERLSDSLKELFTQEGHVLYEESLDTKKLTQMVRDLREKMTLFETAQQQIAAERGARKELEKQLLSCVQSLREQEEQRDGIVRLVASLQQELHDASKLGYVRRSLPAHLFQNPNGPAGSSPAQLQQAQLLEQQCEQLKSEANFLKSQLDVAQRDVEAAKDEARRSKQAAQKDLGALWQALQELNKLDALKDKSIQDLVAERVRLAAERDGAQAEARALREQNDGLRRELEEIDHDLVRVASGNNFAPQYRTPEEAPQHVYPTDRDMGAGPGYYGAGYGAPQGAPVNGANWSSSGSAPSSRGSSGPGSAFNSDFGRFGAGAQLVHAPLHGHPSGPPNGYSAQRTPVAHHQLEGKGSRPEPLSEEVLVRQIDQLNDFLSGDGRNRRETLAQPGPPAPPASSTPSRTPNSRPSSGKSGRASQMVPPLPSYDSRSAKPIGTPSMKRAR